MQFELLLIVVQTMKTIKHVQQMKMVAQRAAKYSYMKIGDVTGIY